MFTVFIVALATIIGISIAGGLGGIVCFFGSIFLLIKISE